MADVSEFLSQVLFVGGHGYVAAIEKGEGKEIWRSSLKGSGYKYVTVLLEGNQLFAASGGKLYCLSPDTGEELWFNAMPGLGYGIYSFATTEHPGNGESGAAASVAQSQTSGSSSGSHGMS